MKTLLLSMLTLFLIGCSIDTTKTTIEKSGISDSTILPPHNQLELEKEKHPLVMTIELDTVFFSVRPNRDIKNDTTETFSLKVNISNQSARKITYTDHVCSYADNFSLNKSSDYYIVKPICFSNAIMPVSMKPNDIRIYSIQLQRKKVATNEKNKVSLTFNYNEEYGHNQTQSHIVSSNKIILERLSN